MLIFICFITLVAATLIVRRSRLPALGRSKSDWILDGSGLIVQGAIVPAIQALTAYSALGYLFPGARGRLELSSSAAFLLNFVAVDYIYYWNHRLLHSKRLWEAHAVHHSSEVFDPLITSRNTLWTPALIVYVWINGLMMFLLRDAAPYLLAATITACLDLWRHSPLWLQPRKLPHRLLCAALITPNEHASHHGFDRVDCNFGANLSIWDRLHGTYFSPERVPDRFGIPLNKSLGRRMFHPF